MNIDKDNDITELPFQWLAPGKVHLSCIAGLRDFCAPCATARPGDIIAITAVPRSHLEILGESDFAYVKKTIPGHQIITYLALDVQERHRVAWGSMEIARNRWAPLGSVFPKEHFLPRGSQYRRHRLMIFPFGMIVATEDLRGQDMTLSDPLSQMASHETEAAVFIAGFSIGDAGAHERLAAQKECAAIGRIAIARYIPDDIYVVPTRIF